MEIHNESKKYKPYNKANERGEGIKLKRVSILRMVSGMGQSKDGEWNGSIVGGIGNASKGIGIEP